MSERKPPQTPWEGLNALLKPDTFALIMKNKEGQPIVRIGFDADEQTIEGICERHPDLRSRLEPWVKDRMSERERSLFGNRYSVEYPA